MKSSMIQATTIDWTDIRAQLDKMTLAQIEMLEREDYWAFLESKTEGMSYSDALNVFKEFGLVLKSAYNAKTTARERSA